MKAMVRTVAFETAGCRVRNPEWWFLSLVILLAACGGRSEEEKPLEPIRTIANQNSGTTMFLSVLWPSPIRPLCDGAWTHPVWANVPHRGPSLGRLLRGRSHLPGPAVQCG